MTWWTAKKVDDIWALHYGQNRFFFANRKSKHDFFFLNYSNNTPLIPSDNRSHLISRPLFLITISPVFCDFLLPLWRFGPLTRKLFSWLNKEWGEKRTHMHTYKRIWFRSNGPAWKMLCLQIDFNLKNYAHLKIKIPLHSHSYAICILTFDYSIRKFPTMWRK